MAETTAPGSDTELETVTSADGTEIAFERTGSGPPLVLVHGAVSDRRSWDAMELRSPVAEHFTVYAMDRRGHGESDDGPYEIERIFEDIVAVVDAIDGPVSLLGLSSGALYALGAARQTEKIRESILYEPPVVISEGDEQTFVEMMALLDDGEDEEALALFLRDVAKLLPEEIDLLRSTPYWQDQIELVHTVPLEMAAVTAYEVDPDQFGSVTTPILLYGGSESAQQYKEGIALLADALPNSRVATIEGGGHIGLATAPERFLDELLEFTGESN